MPAPVQVPMLQRHCSDVRFVWNVALEQANYYRPGRPTPGLLERARQLAQARSGTWLGEGSSTVQQQALRDFDQAMQNWWRGSHGRPRWRKAGINEGFCVRDVVIKRLNKRWATVGVPKLGPVRFKLSRPLPATYGMGRVTLDRSGRWHVSFNAPAPAFKRTPTGAVVGLDMGVVTTVTTSDAQRLAMQVLLTSGESQEKRRLQRRFSRQQKDSKRRAKTKYQIARLATREADRRKDWIEKMTTSLVRDYDFIAIEDLKVKNMLRSAKGTLQAPGKMVRQKAGLNRSISSQAWGLFRQRLSDKAANATNPDGSLRPVELMPVNPAYTSQRCSSCGHTCANNRESQAVFDCRSCGHKTNADVNAAMNILAAGLAVTARGGTSRSKRPYEARTLPVAA